MSEEQKISESEKKKEDWMNSKWRPAMGWMYMLTCVTDFVLFPILWSLLQTIMKQPITQWQLIGKFIQPIQSPRNLIHVIHRPIRTHIQARRRNRMIRFQHVDNAPIESRIRRFC